MSDIGLFCLIGETLRDLTHAWDTLWSSIIDLRKLSDDLSLTTSSVYIYFVVSEALQSLTKNKKINSHNTKCIWYDSEMTKNDDIYVDAGQFKSLHRDPGKVGMYIN
jgi:hypothetical protein